MLFKKLISSLTLLLILFSCSESGTVNNTEDVKAVENVQAAEEQVVEEVVEEVVETLTDSVVTRMGLYMFREPGKGLIQNLVAGEVVSTTGSRETVEKTEYSEIITKDGTRGWASTVYIEENAKPAVLKPTTIDDIILFDKNNDSTVSTKQINPFRIVAVDTTLEDPEFSKITWNKLDSWNLSSSYVMNEDISYEKDDIEFAKMVTAYNSAEDREVKQQLFNYLSNLNNISGNYKLHLMMMEVKKDEVVNKDVSEIAQKYQDSVTVFQGKGSINISETPVIAEKTEDFSYKLLDYIVLNSKFINGGVELYIYNTSKLSFATLPAEVEMVSADGVTSYIAVLESLDLFPGESVTVTLDAVEEFDATDLKVNLTFVNGKRVESTLISGEGN